MRRENRTQGPGPARAGSAATFGSLRGLLVLAALAPAFAAPLHATNMSSANNVLAPSDTNAGGDDLSVSAASYRLGVALGEAIAGPRMFSPANYQLGDGIRQLLSYPNTISDSVVVEFSTNTVTLQWSTPGYDGANGRLQPGTRYYVVVASYTVPDILSSVSNYKLSLATSGASPGTVMKAEVTGLLDGTTQFAHVYTRDADGNLSFLSNRSTFMTLSNLVAQVSDLLGQPGIAKAFLSWKHPGPKPSHPAIARFNVFRSTEAGGVFVPVASETLLAHTEKFLTPGSTYYFKVNVQDVAGRTTPASPAIAVVPIIVVPQEPFGLLNEVTANAAALSWSTTTRWDDGSVFDSTGAPNIHELMGYKVFRATDVCFATYSLVATQPVGITSHTDVNGGEHFVYIIKSFNSLGVSIGSVTLDTTGLVYFPADDCLSRAVLTPEQNRLLSKATNGLGQDILLARERRPQDTGGKILQSVSLRALADGGADIKGFHFNDPVTVQLHFQTEGGSPAADIQNLGMFWHNGVEFKKLYGTVDAIGQNVTVRTPNVGMFQIRSQFRDQGSTTFDLSNITSRAFTPNGDGLNDAVTFVFDNPRNAPVTGRIYDMRGNFVADMVPGPVPNSLTWAGTMNNRKVASGVYLYQVKGDGKMFSGSVVAAR